MTDVPGWYGKLPALGDFASRRLSAEWIAHWDGWLAAGLHQLREAAPDTWLNDYLSSPAWRFALLPGALPEGAGDGLRVGVMIPSVDRVGRYFPLVVVSAPLARPADGAQVAALWHWAGQLEDIAVQALQDDWSADALDAALAHTPAPPAAPAPAPAHAVLPAPLASLLSHAAWDALHGCSLWLHDGTPPQVQPALPQGAAFAALFRP